MNSDFFENFIEDGKTIKQFCSTVCYELDLSQLFLFFIKGS
jgi:hypothetical protein